MAIVEENDYHFFIDFGNLHEFGGGKKNLPGRQLDIERDRR